jgi:7,8-dihydro-6-hydroxymethylpterin-pyrophosphokinase
VSGFTALIGIETGVLRGVEILKKSIEILSEFSDITVISSVIRSSREQNQEGSEEYFSIVLKVMVTETSEELVKRLTDLEQYFLLEYFSKYFSAVLLVYAEQLNLVPHLVLPHPQLVQNKVFLIGAVEIWANYIHPILQRPLSVLLTDVDLRGVEFILPGKSLVSLRHISL